MSRLIRIVPLALAAAVLAACGGTSASSGTGAAGGPTTVTIGAESNGAATETPVTVDVVDAIRAELPQAVRDSGTLNVGLGLLPSGSPPLGYVGTD